MLRKTLAALLISFLVSSCAKFSLQPIYKADNFNKISGNYNNIPDTLLNSNLTLIENNYIKPSYSILNLLDRSLKKFSYREDSLDINLKIINHNSILLKASKNDTIFYEKLIKGKVKRNKYFYPKRTFFLIPIPLVYFSFQSSRSRLYVKDETLIFDHASNWWGMVFIFGLSGRDENRMIYNKK